MRASKKDKETLLIYIGWNRATDLLKKQNKNKKRYPKFGRAIYTIEIVVLT